MDRSPPEMSAATAQPEQPKREPKRDAFGRSYATGRRKDAVARVTVIPEDRSDIKVEVTAPNAQLPLTVRSFGGKTIIDGDLHRRIRNCNGNGATSRNESAVSKARR